MRKRKTQIRCTIWNFTDRVFFYDCGCRATCRVCVLKVRYCSYTSDGTYCGGILPTSLSWQRAAPFLSSIARWGFRYSFVRVKHNVVYRPNNLHIANSVFCFFDQSPPIQIYVYICSIIFNILVFLSLRDKHCLQKVFHNILW